MEEHHGQGHALAAAVAPHLVLFPKRNHRRKDIFLDRPLNVAGAPDWMPLFFTCGNWPDSGGFVVVVVKKMVTANHSPHAMVPLQMLGLVLVAVAALLSQTSTAQSATCYAPSALNFTSAQGALWLNGQPFKLKGTSWYSEPSSTTPSFLFLFNASLPQPRYHRWRSKDER